MNRPTTHTLIGIGGAGHGEGGEQLNSLFLRAAGVCGLLILVTVSVGYIGGAPLRRTLTVLRTTLHRISGR
jgi:hypothetical protein